MAKRGPKPRSPAQQKASGANRTHPERQVVALYAEHADRPDPAEIEAPKWLRAPVKKLFFRKVETYRQRGQKVHGFESALAVYCQLEWEIEQAAKTRQPVTASTVTQWRMLAAEFYDTPASQHVRRSEGGTKAANQFANNGRRS